MLKKIQKNRTIRLLTALGIGFAFGFVLQKGGVTGYEVIVNQLLLKDFTVLKIILSAILTGMIGVYTLVNIHVVDLKTKPLLWPEQLEFNNCLTPIQINNPAHHDHCPV